MTRRCLRWPIAGRLTVNLSAVTNETLEEDTEGDWVEAGKQIDRQADRQTKRQTGR